MVKQNLPSHLNYVAALPCEISMFNCIVRFIRTCIVISWTYLHKLKRKSRLQQVFYFIVTFLWTTVQGRLHRTNLGATAPS